MDLKRFFTYFTLSFALIFMVFFLLYGILYNFKLGFVVGCIFGVLFGLFCAGHMERNLKKETMEINSGNKNPQIGLQEYMDDIEEFMYIMRYKRVEETKDQILFQPRMRLKTMGGEVHITKTPYDITINAPVGVIRIFKKQFELKEEFKEKLKDSK